MGQFIGFKSGLFTYTVLRFPSRTKKVIWYYYYNGKDLYNINMEGRAYVKNVKKIEFPETMVEVHIVERLLSRY